MGQYHQFMNFDKKEILENSAPRKLTEWSYQGNSYMLQLEELLKTSWKGDRVLCVGDYVDEFYDDSKFSSILKEIQNENKSLKVNNIYDYPYKEINLLVKKKYPYRFIYNNHQKVYLDLKKQPIQWMIYESENNTIYASKFHPLSLLLSCSNGAGGGDYYSINNEYVGQWVYDSKFIELSDTLLNKNYKEIEISFDETNSKEDNNTKMINYLSEKLKDKPLELIEKLKFDTSLFLSKEEKNKIISEVINNIKEKSLQKNESELEEEIEK